MEYLRAVFDNELNDVGEVTIAGNKFYRDIILRSLDPTAYEDAFVDWCNEKREEKITKADEILSLFDNEGRFLRLKEIYASGSVIPFIGAGMSMKSGYPSWSGFLNKVLNETQVEKEEFTGLIDSGQYERAAQLLYDSLPAGSFLEHVENAFGIERQISGCLQKLPFIFKSAVVTTNFDSLLEKVYQSSDLRGFEEVLLAGDAVDFPKVLGEGRKALVKLHGNARSSRNRVLVQSEYDLHYGANKTLETVINAISSQTLLFIGCSLTVDRILICLKTIADSRGIENIPKHYAFLRLDEPDQRLERRDQLAECNIHPIWYVDDDHDESLEALLEKLIDGVEL